MEFTLRLLRKSNNVDTSRNIKSKTLNVDNKLSTMQIDNEIFVLHSYMQIQQWTPAVVLAQ